ncbi:MAG: DUF4843 domain-containing protein, partial [Bacteroidales bacterium]
MKKIIFNPLMLLVLFTAVFSSCSNEDALYSGRDYVMFSDSLAYMPVTTAEGNYYEVEIAATNVSSVD